MSCSKVGVWYDHYSMMNESKSCSLITSLLELKDLQINNV